MSGYIGSKRSVNFSTVNLPISDGSTEVIMENGGFAQFNSVSEAVTIQANTNAMFFGDVTFQNTVTVNGNLVVIGGDIDFQGDVDIVGSLIYR